MAKKPTPLVTGEPTLDDLFNAVTAYEKAAAAARKAKAKAEELDARKDKLIDASTLENVLYQDSTGKTWFYNGWDFTEVKG